MKNKLSAVVITKNEEKQIKDFLDNISWADEIIVVDDESSDKTKEICRVHGAKVIVNKSEGNFDRQRNIGMDNANGNWIMQMDADERIPHRTAVNIKKAISNSGQHIGFKIIRQNFFMGHPLVYAGGCSYMNKIFKKGKALYIGKSVHEKLKIDGPIGIIDGVVNHYAFDAIEQFINKWGFYSKKEAEEILDKVDKINFKKIKYRLTWKSMKLFYKLYVKKKGYKDGMYGFIWCIANVIGPQIKWMVVWEKALKEGKLEYK